ncbi:unnamed protein product [Arabis nemorensis]|uniref:RNase H type-1 domain-containing protein n=1 Tax=Arabis nemorensis TaxID=586526 RepID=A0A565BMI1_9BRAS|nr:unnamed protein product [Arabis nemorensis]
MVKDTEMLLGGFGVAICDSKGTCMWNVKKIFPLDDSTTLEVAEIVAEMTALTDGLKWTVELGMPNVTFFVLQHVDF